MNTKNDPLAALEGQVEGVRVKVREDWTDPLESVFARVSPPAD